MAYVHQAGFQDIDALRNLERAFPRGEEKNPLLKGKARKESKINRENPFPAFLLNKVFFYLKLGLGKVPLNYRSIIRNNIKKEMGRRERKKRKGGGDIG